MCIATGKKQLNYAAHAPQETTVIIVELDKKSRVHHYFNNVFNVSF